MPKITIDYDSVMKMGALYYGDVQICDLDMASWQAEGTYLCDMIDELVKEHITRGIEK